jgi:cyclic pyranopterin phosphate synthase
MGGDHSGLTHVDDRGQARMVDVSGKDRTPRKAVASGVIRMSPAALEAIETGSAAKGEVLALARAAGILAAKKVPDLIPLCHHTRIDTVRIDFESISGGLSCTCTVLGEDRTGFEMEALTGVSVALLTVYDMLKAVDRTMVLGDMRLVAKSGGKSGEYRWQG